MELSSVGPVVQAVGAGLLAVIFLYLSRGKGNRVLGAAGVGWLFLFAAMTSALFFHRFGVRFEREILLYFKLLFLVALSIAAIRMDREVSLFKPLAVAAIAALPISLLVARVAVSEQRFYQIHVGILAVGWLLISVFIFQSPRAGLGRQFSGLLALLSAGVQFAAVVVSSTASLEFAQQLIAYSSFFDVLATKLGK